MADQAAHAPTPTDLERAEKFTREPFLFEGEVAAVALAPGGARRVALDAALAELDAGLGQADDNDAHEGRDGEQ